MIGGKKPPDVLIGVGPEETRVVVAEDGAPLEYRIERSGQRSEIGDVHLGRVRKVVPALDAAFVDIGGAKPGFLAASEARANNQGGGIGKWVREGDAVIVEVIRDAEGEKGPRLARRADKEGAGLTPRAINDAPLSGRAGVEASPGIRPPHRLHQEPALIYRVLRDWRGPVGRILVGDMAAFGDLKRFCREHRPDLLPRLAYCKDGDALESDGVAERLDELLGDWVTLPSGGRINVARTAALIAIDVDTGGDSSAGVLKDTVFRVNEEAAAEVARQLRLRDLVGLVVVGFVPMRARAERERVLAALKRATAADPAGVNVGGFTRFGLVELTRRRRRSRR